MATKVSIVDLSIIRKGETATQALAQSLDTARLADDLGFHRIWFAEHHITRTQASHHPEVLIAAAGALTRRIRVGSGAVLMNHYSPFKVAEMFKQLEALYPGRVDLGMGRATSGPVIDAALKRDRQSQTVNDHASQVTEAVLWLNDAFPPEHPFSQYPIVATVPSRPETWLMGSSPYTGTLAAQLGIGHTFAAFINPNAAVTALRGYRDAFVSTPFGAQAPRAMLSVNVVVGETDEHAQRLVLSVKGFYHRLARESGITAYIPSIEEADAEIDDQARNEPTSIVGSRWPRFVAGSAERVKATLDEMIEQTGADELMLQNQILDPEDRAGSHRRIAAMFGLKGD